MVIARLHYQLPHEPDPTYGHVVIMYEADNEADMENMNKQIASLIEQRIDHSLTWRNQYYG